MFFSPLVLSRNDFRSTEDVEKIEFDEEDARPSTLANLLAILRSDMIYYAVVAFWRPVSPVLKMSPHEK